MYVNTFLNQNGIFFTGDTMIGESLKYMRKSNKMKQETLAKCLGISQQNLSRYENNQRIVSFDIIEALANECGYKIYFENMENHDKFELKDLERKDI